jgi:DNA invertase Pin-like site-specific DNA recombinase
MTRTAIYARISKDDRDDHLGVDRQERLCRDLAERVGLDVVMVLADNDASAYDRKPRPGFEALVEALKNGDVDAVCVYHVDRLYRRTTDLERLVTVVEATGTTVHTVAAGNVDLATASGRMIARMLGATAQHEVERLSERLKAKMDELAAAGKPPGGRPPYGYGPGYAVNREEAKTVRLIARRVLEGQSLLSIARELDGLGHTTREGRSWHHSTVRAVVVNPAVAGLRVHRREIAGTGSWKPVLERPTWEQVRAVLADPARKRRQPAHRYLLTRLVEGCAGDPMVGRPDRGAGGRTDRRTYATRSPAKQSLAIDAEELESAVIEMMLTALDGSVLPSAAPRAAETDVSAIESEMAELATARGEGKITMAEWLTARAPLQERLDVARDAARRTKRPPTIARLIDEPGAVRRAWSRLDFATRRSIIETLIDKVIVGPATRARWTTIEERLDPEKGYGVIWNA